MIIGVPKEIKKEEWKVALIPAGAKALVDRGHKVLVEKGAGIASGFSDNEYQEAGAKLISDKRSLFDEADMIVKVKEPLSSEFDLFHEE
jgi:alanine dehydrogenase